MKKIIEIFMMCAALASSGGVVHKWTAETSEISPESVTAYHGETVELECQMMSYGKSVSCSCSTAQFLWQTNGMGTAWWTTNATFSAGKAKFAWTPYQDTGSDSYVFFFQVTDAKGSNYRANGTMALLGSPYGDVRFLPLPQKIIDFNQTTILNATNAPWILKGSDVVTPYQVTNIAEYVVLTNGLATTNYVNEKIGDIRADRITSGTNTIYATGDWVTRTNETAGVAVTNRLATVSDVNKKQDKIDDYTTTNAVCAIVTSYDETNLTPRIDVKRDMTNNVCAQSQLGIGEWDASRVVAAYRDKFEDPTTGLQGVRCLEYYGDSKWHWLVKVNTAYISGEAYSIPFDTLEEASNACDLVVIDDEWSITSRITRAGKATVGRVYVTDNYVVGNEEFVTATNNLTTSVSALATATNNLTSSVSGLSTTVSALATTSAAHTASISALSTTVSNKADKATTLSGYGITDAYTKDETIKVISKEVTNDVPVTFTAWHPMPQTNMVATEEYIFTKVFRSGGRWYIDGYNKSQTWKWRSLGLYGGGDNALVLSNSVYDITVSREVSSTRNALGLAYWRDTTNLIVSATNALSSTATGLSASNETTGVWQKVYPVIVDGVVQWRVKE